MRDSRWELYRERRGHAPEGDGWMGDAQRGKRGGSHRAYPVCRPPPAGFDLSTPQSRRWMRSLIVATCPAHTRAMPVGDGQGVRKKGRAEEDGFPCVGSLTGWRSPTGYDSIQDLPRVERNIIMTNRHPIVPLPSVRCRETSRDLHPRMSRNDQEMTSMISFDIVRYRSISFEGTEHVLVRSSRQTR